MAISFNPQALWDSAFPGQKKLASSRANPDGRGANLKQLGALEAQVKAGLIFHGSLVAALASCVWGRMVPGGRLLIGRVGVHAGTLLSQQQNAQAWSPNLRPPSPVPKIRTAKLIRGEQIALAK
jgi:hypothetical protein